MRKEEKLKAKEKRKDILIWIQSSKEKLGEIRKRGFSGGLVVRSLPANSGDTGSIPDPRRIPHSMGVSSLM